MNHSILFDQRGPVGVVTLNRPERLNAIDHGMLRSLKAFFEERHRDYATRVIIVTGGRPDQDVSPSRRTPPTS